MEEVSLLRIVFALLFVLGLIGSLAFVVRRFDLDKRLLPRGSKTARLGVEEMLMIDGKHRLVLVRRDEVRHLILVGPTECVVIENQIPALPRPKDIPHAA